jgi:hypothetical protein
VADPLVWRGGGGILKFVGVCGQEFEMDYADDGTLGCSADGVGCIG